MGQQGIYRLLCSEFDYDYGDIYDDDYYNDDYGGESTDINDEGTTTAGATESNGGGTTTEDDQNDRRKRSISAKSTNKTKKSKNKLKRTNSASSVLGLNILLYQDLDDYYKPPSWQSVVQNSYLGFKVSIPTQWYTAPIIIIERLSIISVFTVPLFSQILVHDPYSFPLVIGRGMSVGIGQEAFVSVNAQSRMRLVANNRTPSYGSIFLTFCTIHKK